MNTCAYCPAPTVISLTVEVIIDGYKTRLPTVWLCTSHYDRGFPTPDTETMRQKAQAYAVGCFAAGYMDERE